MKPEYIMTKDLELGDMVVTSHGTIWLVDRIDDSHGFATKLFPSPAVFNLTSWPTDDSETRVFSEGTLIKAKLIQ